MAKFCATTILDAALHVITANVIKVIVAKNAPTDSSSMGVSECLSTGADATSIQLAAHVLATATGTDFQLAAGDVSGRKLTISEQATIDVSATGVASHIILMSSVTNLIYYYTTCTTQVLGSTANKVTIPAWDIEFRDAT